MDFKRRKLDIDIPEPDTIDEQWLTQLVEDILSTEQQNATERSRHSNDPLKFMDSETRLYAQIKSLANITLSPSLSSNPKTLLLIISSLLQHPNADIIEQTILTLSDMIDHESEEYQYTFIDQLTKSTIVTDILSKRDYRLPAFEIIEELCEYESLKMYESPIIEMVFDILNRDETDVDALYALVYKLVALNVEYFCERYVSEMEILLVALNKHKDEPTDALNDIVDTIRLCITTKKGYQNFLKYDGFGLILVVMRSGTWGFESFLKIASQVFDSLNEPKNVELATELIQTDGFLRNVFKYFESNAKQVLKLFVSLMVFLPFHSDERLRVINKVMSKKGKQLRALLQLQNTSMMAVQNVGDFTFDDLYLEKIEAGLDILQLICVLLAWLLIEDDELAKELIGLYQVSQEVIVDVLEGYKEELEFNYDNSEPIQRQEALEDLNMINELVGSIKS